MSSTCDSTIRTTKTACGFTLALSHGIVYPLTPCCEASAKGNVGVTCRECGQAVDDRYGDASPEYWLGLSRMMMRLGCPTPEDCATHTLWQLGA